MKKQKIITLLLLLVAFSSQAQNNTILKGRAFLIPLNPIVITAGVALEHLITPHLSLQGMYNYYTIDSDSRFGALTFSSSVNREFIPELRYYFSNPKNFKSSTFASIYGIHRRKTGNVFFFSSSGGGGNQIITIKDNGVGLLLGQNIPISKRFYFDLYIGGSLERSTKMVENQFSADANVSFKHKSPRVGMNFCILF
jgi:hypothetical protein